MDMRTPFTWEWQYLDLMKEILSDGSRQKNRTGIDTLMIPGAMMKINLRLGFPAVTTKKLFFDSVKGELIGFLRGYTSAAQFRELGCKIWDQNANENEKWIASRYRAGEDDLGYIYSRLWTDMPHVEQYAQWNEEKRDYEEGYTWNQIERLIESIKKDPTSRRLIVSAWHPEVFDKAALPPCHVLFQVIIDQEKSMMHMNMYQRSCDMFLGVPFNVASYALLTHLLAEVTGYEVGTLTWFGADCHIYENHVKAVVEQIGRDPFPSPGLHLDPLACLAEYPGYVRPEEIALTNYQHHGVIKAPMAV